MNILAINLDKAIFNSGSDSLERLKEYSSLVDKLFVITWTRKSEKPIEYGGRLFIYPTNSLTRLGYFFGTLRLTNKIMAKNHIDLVFTQDPFETGLAGWIISKLRGIPLQLQVHTDFMNAFFWSESFANKTRVLLARFLAPRATNLRVVSERVKNSLVKKMKIAPDTITILPIFVDVNKINNYAVKTNLRRKYNQFDFIILMASRFSREKNIGLGIAALSDVVQRHPNAGLIIVGGGSEKRKLEKLAVTYGVKNNVIFEPWTDDIVSYYKTADLFLLTSNYEGYGMGVIEAVSAGCVAVMTDVGCAGWIIKNMVNGIIVPVGGKQEISEAILRLMSDARLRERLKKNALSTLSLGDKKTYLSGYRSSFARGIIGLRG